MGDIPFAVHCNLFVLYVVFVPLNPYSYLAHLPSHGNNQSVLFICATLSV